MISNLYVGILFHRRQRRLEKVDLLFDAHFCGSIDFVGVVGVVGVAVPTAASFLVHVEQIPDGRLPARFRVG